MTALFRRILALLLSFVSCLSVSFGGTAVRTWRPDNKTAAVNDIAGDSALSDSVLLASRMSNGVQCVYANAKRTAYRMTNNVMTLTHTLGKFGNGATLTDANGKVYVRDSFDAWCRDADGAVWRASDSPEAGRVNTIRLGKYYYDVHVRDYDLKPGAFRADKEFHVWSDRLYMQYSLFADEAMSGPEAFGAQIRIPVKTVAALRIQDASGAHSDTAADPESVTFAAFDIKDAGVVGFILPVTGQTRSLSVEKERGEYVVTLTADYEPGAGINKFDETGGYGLNRVTFGCRIYTDGSHGFEGVERAAFEERNPLAVTAEDGRKVSYEALRGCYAVELPGTWFQYAYDNPDTRFPVTLNVPAGEDRDIWVRAWTEAGGLEACVVLDDTGTLAPIDVQVSKNFGGDIAEHYYSVRDYSYGDAYFPVAAKADRDITLTAVHLYQNWGNVPLKQLSSIEFHTSYYHLSTGTTESNCISPYFADGKDGFILPDFRGRSGIMWSGQPQFNAVGKPCFMLDRSYLPQTVAEFEGNVIRSVGPTDADLEMRFLSGDGSYRYTLRHVEFPQTDENRVYYTVDVEFLKNKTYLNFRSEVDLFFQTGRFVEYKTLAYAGADGKETTAPFERGLIQKYHRLGGEIPWYTLMTIDDTEEAIRNNTFGGNSATIIRDYSIIRGGKSADIPFTVRTFSFNDFTDSALTLDVGPVTFRKGDSIRLDLILMPWGTGLETDWENVRKVLDDSAANRLTASAEKGSVVDDDVIPTVRCDNNEAVFTVSGGGNNTVVRVEGFTRFGELAVEEKTGSGWTPVELSSACGYDGYGVRYNADGTYGYSFVYGSDGTPRTFRATVA